MWVQGGGLELVDDSRLIGKALRFNMANAVDGFFLEHSLCAQAGGAGGLEPFTGLASRLEVGPAPARLTNSTETCLSGLFKNSGDVKSAHIPIASLAVSKMALGSGDAGSSIRHRLGSSTSRLLSFRPGLGFGF